ncbi:MAG: recombinase family protein [Isosphaeraceae bacterium]
MASEHARIIAYYRVSTAKQGESGLGLLAQREAVERYLQTYGGLLLREYQEIESGKKADRPQLARALADARHSRAKLVIAKFDRLARNVHFLSGLIESGVDFVACDNPHANRLTIHILAAVAEDEARRISERTKAALAAYREAGAVSKRIRAAHPAGVPDLVVAEYGGKLGSRRPGAHRLKGGANPRATARASEARRREAERAYDHLAGLIAGWRSEGRSLREIAGKLDELGHQTRRGRPWSAEQVRRVLARIGGPPTH